MAFRNVISRPLQRPVERGADGGIPRIQPERLNPVSTGSGEIGAEAFARERRLEPVQEVLAVGKPFDFAVSAHHTSRVRPGPASASWYAPGVLLVRAAVMRGDSLREERSGSPGSV